MDIRCEQHGTYVCAHVLDEVLHYWGYTPIRQYQLYGLHVGQINHDSAEASKSEWIVTDGEVTSIVLAHKIFVLGLRWMSWKDEVTPIYGYQERFAIEVKIQHVATVLAAGSRLASGIS